jgi:hypothetical protein
VRWGSLEDMLLHACARREFVDYNSLARRSTGSQVVLLQTSKQANHKHSQANTQSTKHRDSETDTRRRPNKQ